jgi:hypothetical protein
MTNSSRSATLGRSDLPEEANRMNETPHVEIEVDPRADQEAQVHAWRAEKLRELGLPGLVAEIFADRVDWHDIAALVRRGCPTGLALEIVR